MGVSGKVFLEEMSVWTSREDTDGPHQHAQFSELPKGLKKTQVGGRIPFLFMKADIYPSVNSRASTPPVLELWVSISSHLWTMTHPLLLPLDHDTSTLSALGL